MDIKITFGNDSGETKTMTVHELTVDYMRVTNELETAQKAKERLQKQRRELRELFREAEQSVIELRADVLGLQQKLEEKSNTLNSIILGRRNAQQRKVDELQANLEWKSNSLQAALRDRDSAFNEVRQLEQQLRTVKGERDELNNRLTAANLAISRLTMDGPSGGITVTNEVSTPKPSSQFADPAELFHDESEKRYPRIDEFKLENITLTASGDDVAGVENYYDGDTMNKVYQAMVTSGLTGEAATHLIGAVQNAGILFRERCESEKNHPELTYDADDDQHYPRYGESVDQERILETIAGQEALAAEDDEPTITLDEVGVMDLIADIAMATWRAATR